MNADVVWDGIFGALIGSTVTAGAVVATIKYDASNRASDRLDDAVGQAQAAVDAFGYSALIDGLKPASTKAAMRTALNALPAVTARARRREPRLAKLVNDASEDLSDALQRVSQDDIIASAQRASIALLSWFGRTAEIRKGQFTYDDVRRIHQPS
jgi:hypothetical protein